MDKFGRSVLNICLLVVGTMLNGLVFSSLWAWFIMTAFDAPRLSVSGAIGVCFVHGYLFANLNETSKDTYAVSASTRIAFCVLMLLMGWVLHHILYA